MARFPFQLSFSSLISPILAIKNNWKKSAKLFKPLIYNYSLKFCSIKCFPSFGILKIESKRAKTPFPQNFLIFLWFCRILPTGGCVELLAWYMALIGSCTRHLLHAFSFPRFFLRLTVLPGSCTRLPGSFFVLLLKFHAQ